MNVDELTIGDARKLCSMLGNATFHGPWQVGQPYFIRTVTMYLTGRLIAVHPQELVIEDAAWIADTGRFAQFADNGEAEEVEPFPHRREVIIGRGSVIDAFVLDSLPRSQK
jgi:hypothetical protein